MKFGVREICDVVFKAKADTRIGSTLFKMEKKEKQIIVIMKNLKKY